MNELPRGAGFVLSNVLEMESLFQKYLPLNAGAIVSLHGVNHLRNLLLVLFQSKIQKTEKTLEHYLLV